MEYWPGLSNCVSCNKMNEPYSGLENIWNRLHTGELVDIESGIRALLSRQGIKIRQNDGVLRQINLSIPKTIEDAFVIGLRYVKRDGTCTEDHFLCQKHMEPSASRLQIEPHYKKRLEFKLPEYRGTHKEQVDFTQSVFMGSTITQANTITYFRRDK